MNNITVQKTIEYLNEVASTDYMPDYPQTIEALTNLMNLGYGLEDFKRVIDKKWKQWRGTKYQVYVRPATLFGKNFENYLNEPERHSKNNIQQLAQAVQRAKQHFRNMDKGR